MIVKLQRAISPPNAPAYAYTERKAWQQLLPLTPELEKIFGDKLKVFVEAELGDGDLVIGKIVADRGW